MNFKRKHIPFFMSMLLVGSLNFGAATIVPDEEDFTHESDSDDKKRTEPKESKEVKQISDLVNWKEISKKKELSEIATKSLEDRIAKLPKELQTVVGKKWLKQHWDNVSSDNMEALYFALWNDSPGTRNGDLFDFLHSLRKYLLQRPLLTENLIFKGNYIRENHVDETISKTVALNFERASDTFVSSSEFAKKYNRNVPGQVLCVVCPNAKIKWLFSDEHMAIISTLTNEQIEYIKSLYLRNNTDLWDIDMLEFFRSSVERSGGNSHTSRMPSWLIKDETHIRRSFLPTLLLNVKDETLHKSLPVQVRKTLESNYCILKQSQLIKNQREQNAKKCGKISLLLYLAACAPVLAYQLFFGQ